VVCVEEFGDYCVCSLIGIVKVYDVCGVVFDELDEVVV